MTPTPEPTPRTNDQIIDARSSFIAGGYVSADFARTLERETIQLKKELKGAKLERDNWKQWHENTRLGGQELAIQRDHHKLRAEAWQKMAVEYHEAVNDSESAIEKAEARFNTLNQKSPCPSPNTNSE